MPAPRRGLVPPSTLVKGSLSRKAAGGGFRSIVAAGSSVQAASVADAASSTTLAISIAEPGIADRLVLMGGAAVALVASSAEGPLVGSYLTTLSFNGDNFISGNVPATIFSSISNVSPFIGAVLIPGTSQISVIVQNQSGAAVEYGFAFTCI